MVHRDVDPSPEPRAPSTAHYRLCTRAYAIGAVAHLTLPDAMQISWVPANLVLFAGAAGLAFAPLQFAALSFLACAVGLAWPLLLLGDQLTQSAFMLAVALAGLSCALPSKRRRARLGQTFPACLRALTAGAYLIAAFHKLNADFLNPELSCATGGMQILARNWSLPWLAFEPAMELWPPLFLAAELGLLVALRVRPIVGLAWALVMHIPLTIIFAPSFAYVMAPGWIAFVDADLFTRLVKRAKERWRLALAIGGSLGVLSATLYFQDHWVPYPLWQFKEFLLWLAFGFVAVALPALFNATSRFPKTNRVLPAIWLALWLLNGATPYLGLQFHHAGAMLSNLRADRACWNHVLVPRGAQVFDPYLSWRSAPPELQELLLTRRSLGGQAEALCVEGAARPIAGDDRAGAFEADLCALPDPSGPSLFQNELPVTCHQRCMH